MTCVIGLVTDGHVIMGADSASVSGWTVRKTRLPKVFSHQGVFVIGYTTSFRMGQILRWHLEVPLQEPEQSDLEYMVTVFVKAVRSVLKEHGFAKLDDNVETGGEFLVGYRGCLYEVCSDFQVNEHADGFDAVGCGESFALGAMKALDGVGLSPQLRVMRALEVAAHFSGGVCEPFKVMEL